MKEHNILTIGHRGSIVDATTENSINAFMYGIDCGLDMVELDVVPCKTGELIVMHDDTIDRTTNGTGMVCEMTLDEIKQYRLNDGQDIPTLSEVFDAIDRRCKINIELKVTEGVAQKVVDLVREYVETKGWEYGDFLISSFDHYSLLPFREQLPEIGCSTIISGIPIGYAEFGERVGAYSINVNRAILRQELVDDAHRRGMKVYAWVANTKDQVDRLLAMGVDGIFTDYPELLKDVNGTCD